MIKIKDKKIVIVGASSGIGKELAKICVEKEAIVYLISRTERKLLNLQNELDQLVKFNIFYIFAPIWDTSITKMIF